MWLYMIGAVAGLLTYLAMRYLVVRPTEILAAALFRMMLPRVGVVADGDYLGHTVFGAIPGYTPVTLRSIMDRRPQGRPAPAAAQEGTHRSIGRCRMDITDMLRARYKDLEPEVLEAAMADDAAVRGISPDVESWTPRLARAFAAVHAYRLDVPEDVVAHFVLYEDLEDSVTMLAAEHRLSDVAAAWHAFPEAREYPLLFRQLGAMMVMKGLELRTWYGRYLAAATAKAGIPHLDDQGASVVLAMLKRVQQQRDIEAWYDLRFRACDTSPV